MEIKCIKCGKIWNYQGKSKYYITCSSCKKSIKINGPILKKYYTDNDIISRVQKYFKINGAFKKTDFCKVTNISYSVPRSRFGSLDRLAMEAGIEWLSAKGNIGSNEEKILDKIEEQKQIKLKRQFPIGRFLVDGYDPINNIVYEVDERYHNQRIKQDKIREQQIINTLNCNVIRIKDGW